MKVKNDQSFIKDVIPIQVVDKHQTTTVGVALIAQEGSSTIFLRDDFKIPSTIRCRRSATAIEFRSAKFAGYEEIEQEAFMQLFLDGLVESTKASSQKERFDALVRQFANRTRLLRDALLVPSDWKIRLVLKYELDMVTRHSDALRQTIGPRLSSSVA